MPYSVKDIQALRPQIHEIHLESEDYNPAVFLEKLHQNTEIHAYKQYR